MVKVLEFGSIKYLPDNWKKGMPREQILNSAMRHLTAMLDGEEIDSESGLPHSAHVACNMMFLSYFEQGLGSEKAMEFYSQKPIPPLTTAEFNEALKEYQVKPKGEAIVPPQGYGLINLEKAEILRNITKPLNFIVRTKEGEYYHYDYDTTLALSLKAIILSGHTVWLNYKDWQEHFGNATT